MKALFLTCIPLILFANPKGGISIAGTVDIHQIEQHVLEIVASDKAIVEWDEFSIDMHEITRFIQPDASSIVLNRVSSQNISQLKGALYANGQVVLVNPNGILVGESGVLNGASLIASSMDIHTDTFLSKGQIVFSKGSSANVTHLGRIESFSGETLLFGQNLAVEGKIFSRNGEMGGRIHLLGDEISIGSAAILNADGVNGGFIGVGIDSVRGLKADRVFTQEGATLSASSLGDGNGGKVYLYGTSSLVHRGSIFAEGGPFFGDGGFVDLSTASSFDCSGTVSTAAPNGKTGTLVFDPIDLTISIPPGDVSVTAGPNFFPTAIGANLTPATIVAALAGNNVVISTVGTAGPQTGAITVNDAVAWSTNNSLSFFADGNIVINQSVENLNPGAGAISAQSNSGSIFIGNAAMTLPARFGSDRGAVTVIACQGDVVLRGSDAANAAYAVIGGHNTPAPPIVATGNLTVQAGRNLIMQSGTGLTVGPGLQQRCFAAITKMGVQVNVNVDSDIFVTVGQDLIMDTSGADESETYIGHGGVFFGASTIRGNVTVNVARDATLTSRWDGSALSDTRCYIGSSAVAASHRSILNVNIGRDLRFQGAPGFIPQGAHSYIGGGGSNTLSNYRQQLLLNVGRDFIMDARLLVIATIQTNNDSADPTILPINRIHVGRNMFMLGGNFASARALIRNFQSTLPFTNEIFVGGNLICINGSGAASEAALTFPQPGPSLTNIGTFNVRAGGDILLAAGINGQNLFRSRGGVTFISDYGFAPGELWTAQSASVCGGGNIFAGTALGTNSPSLPSNGLGGIQIDTGRYNNTGYNFNTLSGQVLVAPGVNFLTYAMQNGANFLWRSASQFASKAGETNLLISNTPNGLLVNNTLVGAPFTTNGANISISGFQNINISGPSLTAPSGNIFVSAQNDMNLQSSTIAASGTVFLVVDNQEPSAPLIGPGAFTMDGLSQITGSSIGIYTAQRDQNSIDAGALFNGVDIATIFANAGLGYDLTAPLTALFENTERELWCIYFQQALPFSPLTIFYKPCFQTVTEQANEIVSELLFTFSDSPDWPFHGLNEYYGWPAKFIFYYNLYPTREDYQNWPNELYFLKRKNELLVTPRNHHDWERLPYRR